MIQAKDLRCNNLLQSDCEEPEIVKITAIDSIESLIIIDSQSKWEPLDGYLPIPLTEEWLVKCGFYETDSHKQNVDKEFRRAGDHTYSVGITEGACILFYNNKFGHIILQTPDYVHSLMNLFHALTGTE